MLREGEPCRQAESHSSIVRAATRSMISGGCVHAASQLTLGRRDVTLSKTPLPALFESGKNVPARKFVDGVGAEVEQKGDLPGVQQYIVSIGHHSPTRRSPFVKFEEPLSNTTDFCDVKFTSRQSYVQSKIRQIR